jgi:hypothetical protein
MKSYNRLDLKIISILIIVVFLGIRIVKGSDVPQFTEVSGTISEDTTWTAENNPYIIFSTTEIASGVTLSIEPGVVVVMKNSGDMFFVKGNIIAHGTEENNIIFDGWETSNFFDSDWGANANLDMEYCVFQRGGCFISYALNDFNNLIIRNCEFIQLSGENWIFNVRGDLIFEYNTFIDSGGFWLSFDGNNDYIINNNLFYDTNGLTIETWSYSVVFLQYNSFVEMTRVVSLSELGNNAVIATDNFWNTHDKNIIESLIHDKKDNIKISTELILDPILTEPHENTPVLPENKNPYPVEAETQIDCAITFSASSTQITYGDNITLSGKITPPTDLPIEILSWKEHKKTQITILEQTENGTFTYEFTPLKAESYKFNARMEGNDHYHTAYSESVMVEVNKIQTSIECSLSADQIIEEEIIVQGTVRPAFEYSDPPLVVIVFSKPSEPIRDDTRVARVDSDGKFEIKYKPNDVGEWFVIVSWDGDEYYTEFESTQLSFIYGVRVCNLKITVKDANNNPLSGVSVSDTSKPSGQSSVNGITGSGGSLTFKDIMPGNYDIEASKDGYLTKSGSVSATAGETVELTITLEREAKPAEEKSSGGGGIPGFSVESITLGLMLGALMLWIMRARTNR